MTRPTSDPTSRQRKRLSRTLDIPVLRPDQIDSFWFRVQRRNGSDCWFWNGAASKFGHGRVKFGKTLYSPHRVAYCLTHGPIPDRPEYHGSVVMHTCDEPLCCNPKHLVLGTQQRNVIDMVEKGRGGWEVNAPCGRASA